MIFGADGGWNCAKTRYVSTPHHALPFAQYWCMADLMPRLALILTLLIALAIAYGTLSPPGAQGRAWPLTDKQIHALAFALLMLPGALIAPRLARRLAPVALAFGGAIELIQPGFGRSAEWGDFLADGIGIVAGLLLGWAARRVFTRPGPGNTA